MRVKFHHKDAPLPNNQSQILTIFIQFQLNTRTKPGTDDNKVHLSLVNTRSLPSKGEELKYYITEKTIDICAITERCIHKDATEESLKAVTPEGYVISSKPHLDGSRGGGKELIYNKESVTLSDRRSKTKTSTGTKGLRAKSSKTKRSKYKNIKNQKI